MERYGATRPLFKIKGKATRSVTLGDGEKMEVANMSEELLNVQEYVRKCADPLAIKNLAVLLSTYETNSDNTNHQLCKLWNRIAFKLDAVHIFYQVCQEVLSSP